MAIVDDIGSILVIAVFYSTGIGWGSLLAAAALVGQIVVLRRVGVWSISVYVVLGVGVWLLVRDSGVHATIAGVVIGLLTPTRPLRPDMADPERSNGWSTGCASRSSRPARDCRSS